jgi:hypothetical protein
VHLFEDSVVLVLGVWAQKVDGLERDRLVGLLYGIRRRKDAGLAGCCVRGPTLLIHFFSILRPTFLTWPLRNADLLLVRTNNVAVVKDGCHLIC